MPTDVLKLWTVYKQPRDYAKNYVARQFEVGEKGLKATENIIVTNDLETLRSILLVDMRLTRIERLPEDEHQIVETWI